MDGFPNNTHWDKSGQPPLINDLNFLDEPNFFSDIDEKTLECLIGNPAPQPEIVGNDGAGPSKRPCWVVEDASVPEEETDERQKKGKRAKLPEVAAAKASREKARRERLNSCFDELAFLCNPASQGTRGDRISILVDAIRTVKQLRVESNQLRQLNKFLEERVSSYEHAQAQTIYMRVPPPSGPGGEHTPSHIPDPSHLKPWLPAPNITQDQRLRPPAA